MSAPRFSALKKGSSPSENTGIDPPPMNLDEAAVAQALPAEQPKTKATKHLPKKKEKKIKDPAAPKRPLSAYFVFMKKQRPLLLAELGNLTVGELGKEFGRSWASMDQQQRQPYEESIKDDWICYREEIKAYQPSSEFLEKKTELSAAGAAYNGSMLSNIDDGVEAYFGHLMNSWRALSLARPDLSGKEIQDLVWSSWISNISTCKVKKVKDPAEPKKPKSGFQLFVDCQRQGVKDDTPGIDSKEINKKLKENWENIDEDIRKPYLEKAVELQDRYQEHI